MEISDNRKRIGNKIAQLRKEAGLSQEKLAEMAGIDRTNVSKMENGRYNISIDLLSKVAYALNTDIDLVKRPKK